MRRIFVAAGGTGGHIFPALSVAKQLIKDGNQVIWIGATHGLENEIIPKNSIRLETIPISGIRKKGLRKLLFLPFTLSRAFFVALKLILKERPDAIIGFGGYATFPICIMGRVLRVPTLIHEQNKITGLSNKILSYLVDKVLVAFDGVLPSPKTIVVGNPVRSEIANILPPHERYILNSGGLNILVIGGSLGARIFNQILPEAFANCNNIGEITHQAGRNNSIEVKDLYQKNNIKANVVDFIDNMAEAYNKADLIICRAGASTVSEVAAVGVAAIFVPYPYAVDNHQYHNARYLESCNAAEILIQKDLTPDKMRSIIMHLSREKCLKMAENGRKYAKINSTADICNIIYSFL